MKSFFKIGGISLIQWSTYVLTDTKKTFNKTVPTRSKYVFGRSERVDRPKIGTNYVQVLYAIKKKQANVLYLIGTLKQRISTVDWKFFFIGTRDRPSIS